MNRHTRSLIILLIIGAAALAGALLCERISDKKSMKPTRECTDEDILSLPYFDIVAVSGENRNLPCDIISYSIGDGYIHLLLPENVNREAVTVYIRDMEGDLLARRVYDFTHKVMIGDWEIVADHHDIPVLYFETHDPQVYADMISSEKKDIICGGNLHVCAGGEVDKALSFSTAASLQGRGASSWEACQSKKSYSLRLNKSQNILGLGSNRNWNLIGNAFDVSLIRNVTFNHIAEEMGIRYQPEMMNVVLYVDGKYEGVYTLTTKMTIDKDRIALKAGDYFYRKQPDDAIQPVPYTSNTWFDEGNNAPMAELIFPENASEDEQKESAEIFQHFIDAVEDPSFEDLDSVCDISSLAKYYWIQEASMNIDAWERGVYLYYKGEDKKMYPGPVWDMDLTLGSPVPKIGVYFDDPAGWKIREGGWYRRLFDNDEFTAAVADEYQNGGVREALFDGIEEFERQKRSLGSDGYLNYLLYGHANEWATVFDHGDSYDEYCDNMIAFYRERVEWIDAQMNR